MIKYFCDRCGKEISSGNFCEECVYEELTCGFKIGDEVITYDGRVGTITDFCTCSSCKQRNFYEPEIEMKSGSQIWMTDTDKDNGFDYFYKIGKRVFGNLDDKRLLGRMETLKEEMQEIESQLDVINRLRENN